MFNETLWWREETKLKGEIIWNRHPSCPHPTPTFLNSVPQYSGAPVSCVVRASERWRAGAAAVALWLDSYIANGKTGKEREGGDERKWEDIGASRWSNRKGILCLSLSIITCGRRRKPPIHPLVYPDRLPRTETVTQLLFSRPTQSQSVQEGGPQPRPNLIVHIGGRWKNGGQYDKSGHHRWNKKSISS
jgi:hypothetical protein